MARRTGTTNGNKKLNQINNAPRNARNYRERIFTTYIEVHKGKRLDMIQDYACSNCMQEGRENGTGGGARLCKMRTTDRNEERVREQRSLTNSYILPLFTKSEAKPA